MKNEVTDPPSKRPHYVRVLVALAIIVILILLVLAIVDGAVDEYDETDRLNESTSKEETTTESAPEGTNEPASPNVTGGSSGAGTGQSNDAATEPSPAGGVDTNNYQTP